MDSNKEKKTGPRRNRPTSRPNKSNKAPKEAPPPPLGPLLNYKLIVFETFKAAKAADEEINAACSECDQLNLVIRAEGDMDDPELLGINTKIKVFAGAAWTLIHERRQEDGWYEIPHRI